MNDPGIYDGKDLPFVPATTYHASPRISRSQLWTLHSRSPAHLRSELDNPTPPTSAMLLGVALHTAILEPERFAKEYLVPSDEVLEADRRTKDGKVVFQAFLEAAATGGLVPLGWNAHASTFEREGVRSLQAISAGLAKDAALSRLLRDGEGSTEATYCWDEDRARYRVRFDRLNRTRQGWVAIDLKTTTDARPKPFQRTLVEHGLHFQAGMYADGFAALRDDTLRSFVFVAIETSPPYAHAIYRCAEDAMDCGRFEYREAAGRLRACIEAGSWPGYADDVQTLNLPPWYT